jgi:uncharacterized protein (TIGR02996 family)
MRDLLPAVLDQPDDDLLRLACADRLEEDGDADRAHLIRFQVEKHRRPENDERAVELEARAEALLAEHERDWLGEWADRLVRWTFARGFLDSVTIEPDVFLRHGEELLGGHPVRLVRFVDPDGQACGPDAVEELVASPAFARVRGVDASGSVPPAGPAWCRALAAAPHLTRVEELDFSSGWRPDGVFHDTAALEALGQATHLAGLRRLRLGAPMSWGAPGDEVVPALVHAAFAPGLEVLRLDGLALTDAGLRRLVRSRALGRLQTLDLSWCEELSREGIRTLLATIDLPRLKELGLGGDFDPIDLADSPLVGRLESLDLCTNTRRYHRELPAWSWRALARSPRSARLRRLSLLFGLLGHEGAQELFHTPGPLFLRSLMLMGQTGDGDELARVVATAPSLAWLTSLELPGCGLTAEGVRALAEAPFARQLRLFCVAGNPIQAAGVRAIVRSPLADGRLLDFHLHHCDLSPATLRRLVRWRGLRRVTRLEVGSDVLDAGVLEALAGSPCGRGLTTLQVGSGDVPAEGLAALANVRGLSRLRTLTLPASADPEAVAGLRGRFGARVVVDPR